MLTNRYGADHTRFDNDWDWEIGSALALNDAAVLLYDVLGTERLGRITAAVRHYTPDPNLWRADRQIATGANRVWISTVVAVNAVLTGTGGDLARVRDALSDVEGSGANSVLAFNDASAAAEGTGEGFYSDGSFLQHYKHPYNGGYGKELLNNLSRLLNLLAGTEWAVTDPDLDNIRGWVDDGFDPLLVRGDVMASVCGREIARPSKQGHVSAQTVIEAVVRLIPSFPGETADRFTSLVKQWIAEDTYRDFLAVTDLASLVAARQVIASTVAGARAAGRAQAAPPDGQGRPPPAVVRARHLRVLVPDLQLRVDPEREPARLAPVRRHGPALHRRPRALQRGLLADRRPVPAARHHRHRGAPGRRGGAAHHQHGRLGGRHRAARHHARRVRHGAARVRQFAARAEELVLPGRRDRLRRLGHRRRRGHGRNGRREPETPRSEGGPAGQRRGGAHGQPAGRPGWTRSGGCMWPEPAAMSSPSPPR